MAIIADLHCHSISSTHAYATINEMLNTAVEKGLYAIAITDHGRTVPGAPGPWYFENLLTLPKKIKNTYFLKGIEANIWDYNGHLDASDIILNRLDWVVASMHEETLPVIKDIDACTHAWLEVAKHPLVNVIGHSGQENFKYNYEQVIPEFGRNGKLVEINNASFRVRSNGIKNCKFIALMCKKYEVPIVINSDAHFTTQIAEVTLAEKLLKEIDFPESLILNKNIDKLEEYLNKYTNFFKK